MLQYDEMRDGVREIVVVVLVGAVVNAAVRGLRVLKVQERRRADDRRVR